MSATAPVCAQRVALLAWLAEPRADRGVRFAHDGGWRLHSYDELAAMTRRAAAQIAEHADPGPAVALLLGTGPDFIAGFYGSLLAGRTPCPIPPPGYYARADAYAAHVARILRSARPGLVICDRDLLDQAERAAAIAGLRRRPVVLDDASRAVLHTEPPADLALLQFTSGSSGTPKGVRVTPANLETNIAQIVAWSRYDAKAEVASWLPLSHDMGLIGCLLVGVTHQGDVAVMRPDQFVRRPARWLERFGRHGASFTAAPTFAFAYAAKRLHPEDLSGMDLSAWRYAVIGAERVNAAPLRAFADLAACAGFSSATFAPAYGMAEATLAITGTPVGDVPVAARLDTVAVRFGGRLDGPRATLTDPGLHDGPSPWLVASGPPLDGVRVGIIDESEQQLPEGHLGEIVVQGPTVASGYTTQPEGQSTRFADERLLTGDAGVLLDGQLYVIGRIGDAISVRGRSVYLEDVEARLEQIPGVPKGRLVVVAGAGEVVALVEAEPGPWISRAQEAMVAHCGTDVQVSVRCATRGAIARTSSGKPRRRLMWQQLLEERLGGTPADASPV
jgi:acyl-CoA synthetase (AMP-forming)/AMP-acid ligase II